MAVASLFRKVVYKHIAALTLFQKVIGPLMTTLLWLPCYAHLATMHLFQEVVSTNLLCSCSAFSISNSLISCLCPTLLSIPSLSFCLLFCTNHLCIAKFLLNSKASSCHIRSFTLVWWGQSPFPFTHSLVNGLKKNSGICFPLEIFHWKEYSNLLDNIENVC